jgi:membrane protein DedA with SNARE-associated domain
MSFSLAGLAYHFGAIGVGLGAGLEGETAVVIGGIAAHHGLFSPIAAWIAAWTGSFAADQGFFLLGRWRRDSRWVQNITQKAAFSRAIGLVERFPAAFCICFRFIYGLRVAGPIAIGVSCVRARLFLLLNFLSAGVWALIFTWLGFTFGHAVERMVRRFFSPQHAAIIAVIVSLVAISIWLWRKYRKLPGSASKHLL